jgi:hypothetical protein
MGKCEYHFIEVMACPSGTFDMFLRVLLKSQYLNCKCGIYIILCDPLVIVLQVV